MRILLAPEIFEEKIKSWEDFEIWHRTWMI